MDLAKAMKTRKSVRNFSGKKPDWRKILQAMEYVPFAPMAGNQFSVKFVLVSDKKKIIKIAEACQQDFVGNVDYKTNINIGMPIKNPISYGYIYFTKLLFNFHLLY